MVPDSFVDEATAQIHNDGVFMMEDFRIGTKIEEIRSNQQSFNFSEEAGFHFWHECVQLNVPLQGIMRKLESDAGSSYSLAYCGSLPPDPGHICTLRNGGDDPGILIVQVWPRASSATFYSSSHTADLRRIRAANNTWEVASKQLEEKGCDAKSLQDSFQEGGFVLFDARIAFERKVQRCYYYTYIWTPLLQQLRQRYDVFGVSPPTSQKPDEVEKMGVYVR